MCHDVHQQIECTQLSAVVSSELQFVKYFSEGQEVADHGHVIRSKAPEQLQNGP